MGKLCQIVAVEKGIKARVKGEVDTLYKAVQKPALFNGFHKDYKPNDEAGAKLPSESQKVQFTAKSLLKLVGDLMGETLTIEARKDWTNCISKANVSVNGTVLVKDAPISYLLYLEKQLTDVRTFVEALPVLDSTDNWTFDENSGLNKTNPSSTHRTEKVNEVLVLYPATDKHPAQTQLVTKDVISGYWSHTKQSGAIAKPEKDAILARIEAVSDAVKIAREEANITEEADAPNVGADIFKFILG